MKLTNGEKGILYTIKSITGDEEISKFLFTLGCFEGETISIVKKMHSNWIVNIKGGRYGIDKDLAEVIEIF
ncbi:MAG: FeoA domain-containing protein [Romboutsia sp.]|nr:FeoA domain-containing protein [Romboutsia sp.]